MEPQDRTGGASRRGTAALRRTQGGSAHRSRRRRRPARKGRARRLLDAYVHQLAPHAQYLRAWAEKYRDQGLVVVGVHTPEFPFAKRMPRTFARPRRRGGVSTGALDPDTARSGPRSPTGTGRPRISRTRSGGSGTTNSVKANTRCASASSSSCCKASPAETTSRATSCPPRTSASRPRPTGGTSNPPETSGFNEHNFRLKPSCHQRPSRVRPAWRTLRLNSWALLGSGRLSRERVSSTKPAERSPSASMLTTSASMSESRSGRRRAASRPNIDRAAPGGLAQGGCRCRGSGDALVQPRLYQLVRQR